MNHLTCINGSIDNFLQTEEIQISLNKEKKSISGIRAAYEQNLNTYCDIALIPHKQSFTNAVILWPFTTIITSLLRLSTIFDQCSPIPVKNSVCKMLPYLRLTMRKLKPFHLTELYPCNLYKPHHFQISSWNIVLKLLSCYLATFLYFKLRFMQIIAYAITIQY